MRKNNKRALYESIMRNVAKTVKKALNENINTNSIVDTNFVKKGRIQGLQKEFVDNFFKGLFEDDDQPLFNNLYPNFQFIDLYYMSDNRNWIDIDDYDRDVFIDGVDMITRKFSFAAEADPEEYNQAYDENCKELSINTQDDVKLIDNIINSSVPIIEMILSVYDDWSNSYEDRDEPCGFNDYIINKENDSGYYDKKSGTFEIYYDLDY